MIIYLALVVKENLTIETVPHYFVSLSIKYALNNSEHHLFISLDYQLYNFCSSSSLFYDLIRGLHWIDKLTKYGKVTRDSGSCFKIVPIWIFKIIMIKSFFIYVLKYQNSKKMLPVVISQSFKSFFVFTHGAGRRSISRHSIRIQSGLFWWQAEFRYWFDTTSTRTARPMGPPRRSRWLLAVAAQWGERPPPWAQVPALRVRRDAHLRLHRAAAPPPRKRQVGSSLALSRPSAAQCAHSLAAGGSVVVREWTQCAFCEHDSSASEVKWSS